MQVFFHGMCRVKQNRSAGAVLDRIQQALGLKSDGEVSRALGIGRSTVGGWRAQDRRPYELCVDLAMKHGLSLDWLLLGRGPMRPAVVEYQQGEDRPDGRRGVNDGDHDQARQDPSDLAAIIAWARAWHASATPDERAWLRVQLRRALPELSTYLDARLGDQDAVAAPNSETGAA